MIDGRFARAITAASCMAGALWIIVIAVVWGFVL